MKKIFGRPISYPMGHRTIKTQKTPERDMSNFSITLREKRVEIHPEITGREDQPKISLKPVQSEEKQAKLKQTRNSPKQTTRKKETKENHNAEDRTTLSQRDQTKQNRREESLR